MKTYRSLVKKTLGGIVEIGDGRSYDEEKCICMPENIEIKARARDFRHG